MEDSDSSDPSRPPPPQPQVKSRSGLTRHDVAADDLPTKRGQRLGHHRDDAPAGGLHVGGPPTGGRYPGPDGADGWSGVGGLGSWGHILGLFTDLSSAELVSAPPGTVLLTCGLSDQLGGHDGAVATDDHDGGRTAAGQSHG